MAKDGFLDLGRDPKRIGPDERKYYPTLPVDTDAMKGMKVGETGDAQIKYKVNGSSIEVQAIKFLGGKAQKEDDKNGGE